MQESPDRYLDAEITQALKFKLVVTPLQKQAARERLLARAAGQTILLPLSVPEEQPLSLVKHVYILGGRTLRVLQVLLLDSSMYERARSPSPHIYEYYTRMGATPSQSSISLLDLRLNALAR